MMHPSQELCCTKSKKLAGKTIVLGVTGSIAAVESVKLAREFIRHGAQIFPVMTASACRIIHPYSLEFATSHPPVTEIDGRVQHVALCGKVGDRADLLLIAPCTANTLSKIASGVDDTTVTTFATTAIGSKIPVMIVMAMHGSMHEHPVVVENIQKLRNIGIHVMEPRLDENKVKMPATEDIVENVIRVLNKKDMQGKRTLVIAGGTEEEIDDIRVISNKSSGKTGLELAICAYERGSDVELWMGRCDVELPGFIPVKRFDTISKLLAMADRMDFDIVLVPAAISDYAPKKKEGKIRSGQEELTLKLKPTPKVIKKIREQKHCFLVGFKAEFNISSDELLNRARFRMEDSHLDLIVANDVSNKTFYENRVFIIGRDGKVEEIKGRKEEIAAKILDRVVSLC